MGARTSQERIMMKPTHAATPINDIQIDTFSNYDRARQACLKKGTVHRRQVGACPRALGGDR